MKKLLKSLVIIISVILLGININSCASCSREWKSLGSDIGGGLHRTATLYDYNGDTIKTWTGKFDIRDSGSDNQIFFDLNGKRIWIQGGIFVSEEL